MHASMGRLRDDMAVLVLGPDPDGACHASRPAEAEPTKESDG